MSIGTSRVMEYDPFSQEFQADPFPVYRWMRDEAPVFYSEKWNWWALSRFEDVRAAATDPQTFLSYEGIDIDDTAKDQAGVGVLSSCAEGTCGTCETAVLGGVPDHRDSVLTQEERAAGDCMMICVSRSCSARLVLDL
jgi:cytochrome P450